jgi:hypothetical protein
LWSRGIAPLVITSGKKLDAKEVVGGLKLKASQIAVFYDQEDVNRWLLKN